MTKKQKASYHKKWNLKNPKKLKQYAETYYKKDPEKRKQQFRSYYYRNRKKCIEAARIRYAKRRKTDPNFKLKTLLRNRLNTMLKTKGLKKVYKYNEYIGCNSKDLKLYIEQKFKKGMNWKNHGKKGWHIDHIIPLSNATNEKELYELSHHTNLQPIWYKDHLLKSNKERKRGKLGRFIRL